MDSSSAKRICFIIIICTAVAAIIGSGAVVAQSSGSGSVDVDATNLPGDGTQSNPYQISNIALTELSETA